MEAKRARTIIHHALSLHVLETEDVSATGRTAREPVALLEALERERALSAAVVDALETLARLSAAQDSATMIAERDARRGELDSATIAPERDRAGGRAPGADVDLSSGTLAPERDRPVVGLLDGATVSPERDDGPPPGALLGATVSPERDDGPPPGALLGATISPERDDGPPPGALLGATISPERERERPASLDSATLAPERDVEVRSPAADRPPRPTGPCAPSLALLPREPRRRIEEAAFARAALRRGIATREQLTSALDRAYEDDRRLEDILVEVGVFDPHVAMEVYTELQEQRGVCAECLGVLATARDAAAACEHCGSRTGTGTGTGTGAGTGAGESSAGGGTIDDGGRTARAKGIEGFPGEGGSFAGYELLERVAEGGMGVVFKARETTLRRIVALKVMRGGALASKSRRRRFLREAESAAALHHPNIVPIHQINEVAGYPFYTMDFVEGSALDAFVRTRAAEPRHVASLLRTIADAVHHFHLRGIIHRDLKPDNILVTQDGAPKIIDFGIAKKLTADLDTEANWTVEGDVLGTPNYMPPEQASGRVQDIDARSDVYALGAILYGLLVGAPPFSGLPQARLIVAIQEEDPPSIRAKRPDVDRDLEAIAEKAMAKERERRYQSALELAQDLARYIEHKPVLAQPATFVYRSRKWIRRRRPYVIAGSIVLLAASAGLGVVLHERRARRLEVERLIVDAGKAPIEGREGLLHQALGKDPGNVAAKAMLSEVAAQLALRHADQRREDELRLAEERRRADVERQRAQLAQAELDTQRAEASVRAADEKEQARLEAEERSRREAEGRARALVAKADAAATPLESVGVLTDALALVPPGSELRASLEGRKVHAAIVLAEEALAQNQAGLAEYWRQEALKLPAASARSADLERLRAALLRLTSGERLREEAHELVVQGAWLAAREKLAQARERGVDPARLAEEVALVEARCADAAQRLVDEGRALLQEGRPGLGLARAREAVGFAGASPIRAHAVALLEVCAERAARGACVEAVRLFARPEQRREALAVLEEAGRTVDGTPAATTILAERRHRTQLLEPGLEDLTYLPVIPELGVAACFILRREVTNAEFKAFVDASGYLDTALFDPEAWDLMPTFVDGTPGEHRHRGPRTWQQGSYGDPSNGDRPVRGITWFEARAFARWLTRSSGCAWRLPTVAEWEGAAGWDPAQRRLLTYPWGEDPPADVLSFGASAPRAGTTTRDSSPLGLLDAGGGVSEWVELPGDPARPALKGAAFLHDATVARHLAKVTVTGTPRPAPPLELLVGVGFRLVREIGADE